jgi:hypothetical protein
LDVPVPVWLPEWFKRVPAWLKLECVCLRLVVRVPVPWVPPVRVLVVVLG